MICTIGCDRNKLPLKRLAPETLRLLIAAPWPGNVRELEHTIERAVLFSPGPDIQPQSIAFGSPTGGALALPTAVNLSHARALLDSAEREKPAPCWTVPSAKNCREPWRRPAAIAPGPPNC